MTFFTRAIALACAMTTAPAALALRCGTNLISEGDLAIQVRNHCGDPASEEVVGYTLRPARIAQGSAVAYERELKIEQWVYGPDSGYYNVLTFEGGRLKRIERIRD
jgi:hypothetical protein